MIWESWPWKVELRRLSRAIKAEAARIPSMDEVDQRSEFKLEAFVIRKLIENKKITDKVAGYSLNAFRSRRPKEGNTVLLYLPRVTSTKSSKLSGLVGFACRQP